ncbi:unnamed protein product [Bursaphelenchus xylophilus]|uniref:(pine wood nematode) hypothetical protein n=1 Tax=Bursaphelenchus xylophilus TaxID=6326 RepID=A0A1I7RYC2_BURXY|nr:unnamed protein product [Bursaphelenchus xylophilus]CAG9085577.1 unnamed protein product [Bursaphelenchus xylophilus]
MLKFQVKASDLRSRAHSPKSLRGKCPPPPPPHRTLIHVRNGQSPSCSSSMSGSSLDLSPSSSGGSSFRKSTSLSSLSSIESSDSTEGGYVKVFTGNIKADTDYKTVKITHNTNAKTIIGMVMAKFRLTYKDSNLFRLCMEIQTPHHGEYIKTLLELDGNAKVLELQKCHPQHLCRFILIMVDDAVLVRVDDSSLCPQSNYKSLLLARNTTSREVTRLLLQLCRIPEAIEKDYRLFLNHNGIEAPIPEDAFVADIYMDLLSNQKLVIKKI